MIFHLNFEFAETIPDSVGIDLDSYKMLKQELTSALVEAIFHRGIYSKSKSKLETLSIFMQKTDMQQRYGLNPHKPEHMLVLGYAFFDADEVARLSIGQALKRSSAVVVSGLPQKTA